MAKQLRDQGRSAFVMPVKSGGATLYRVRVGPLKDRASAEAALRDVKSAPAPRSSRILDRDANGGQAGRRVTGSSRCRIRAPKCSAHRRHGGIARPMNGADYLIVGVLLVSMLLGMLRGFVREAIGLLSWLGGLWLAWRYAPVLEPYLGGMVGKPPVSLWTARAMILLGVLVIGWLIAGLLGYFLRHSALSVLVDRILGLVFGMVRGAVVIAVFVMLGEFVRAQPRSNGGNARTCCRTPASWRAGSRTSRKRA